MLSQTAIKNLGKAVLKDPELHSIVENKYKYLIEKPEPLLHSFFLLDRLCTFFCSHFKISIKDLKASPDYRRKFIAVSINLYNPEFISGFKNAIKDGLADELGEILSVKREWISQQGGYIKDLLNPPSRAANTYQEDRRVLLEVSQKLFSQIKESTI